VSEPTYLYLTTRGRRSGLPREIEIWFTRFEGRFYVIAEHRERAQWVQNLRVDPRARVRVSQGRLQARARIVDARKEPGLAREIRARSTRKYGWGNGLIVELAPVPRPRHPG
jgi:deazaflavin-dependent oxidoreductase (nitroreductase family)